MGNGYGIIEILEEALSTWSQKLSEIWGLITTSPQDFHGGSVWTVIENIHGALKAVAYALLVLFFLIGVVKTTTDFRDLKRPEQALKLFLRFAVAKGVVSYSMDFLLAVYKIVQGIIKKIASSGPALSTAALTLPEAVRSRISGVTFLESMPLWIVSLLMVAVIWVLSVIMILTVYTRFFSLFMYTAIAPVPLAAFASEGTAQIGRHFLKSYASVCLQGAIILLACVIYSSIAVSPPDITGDGSAVSVVWKYMGELAFNLLLLVSAVRISDRLVKEMVGV